MSGHGIAPRAATIERYLRNGASRHPRRRLSARAGPARLRQLDSPAAEIRDAAPVAAAGPGGRADAHRFPDVRRPAREHRRIGEPLPRRMAVLGGGLPGQWPAAEAGYDLAAAGLGGDVRPAPRRWTRSTAQRDDGLRAAYDAFYRGEIAERIVAFAQATHVPRRFRPGAQRPSDARGLQRFQPAARGAGAHRLSRDRGPQVRPVDAGAGAACRR